MTRKTILLLGTLDTKGPEIEYMRTIITGMNLMTMIMDIGVVGPPMVAPDIPRERVCQAGGSSLEEILGHGRRDLAMTVMGRGAAEIARRLYEDGNIGGVAAVGGNQGTWIATTAMKALPLGVPKVMVSTVASGNTRPYIGNTDTAMMFSVADVLGGPNAVTRTILANAAGAIAGMCLATIPISRGPGLGKKVVAVTAFGNLEPAVTRAGAFLRSAGYEVVTFHASGAGGSAMEQLVQQGIISGVLDMVTHEIVGELFPDDVYAPVSPGRLARIVEAGVPLVFVPGGVDYYVFGSVSTVPRRCRGRKIHYHNPNNTNVRLTASELRRVGKVVAERLSPGADAVRVLIPLKGWTEFSREGGPLHDPEADAAFVSSLRRHAAPGLRIREVDLHVNDPEFAELCAATLHDLLSR